MSFVPRDRPEWIDKALHSSADAAILDLEDAVAPDRKAAPRDTVRDFLQRPRAQSPRRLVRVNPVDTPQCDKLFLAVHLVG